MFELELCGKPGPRYNLAESPAVFNLKTVTGSI